MRPKALIFDRDSTLNRTTQILRPGQKPGDPTDGYVLSRAEFELFPCVRPALALLKKNGVKTFVFTQQNGIGKGLITEEGIADIHVYMNELLGPDAAIDGFYFAWSTPGEPPHPRAKPSPLMLQEIMADHALAPEDVLVAGDSMRDYKAAVAAGLRFSWVIDDLRRVSIEDMQKTGCPVFEDVLALVKQYIQA